MKTTNEQRKILNHKVTAGENLVIRAYAGTGKTWILTQYAEKLLADNPSIKILYMAFNKAIVVDAQSKMPSEVTCATAHSRAYGVEGVKYRHKLANINKTAVLKAIPTTYAHSKDKYKRATVILDTLNRYICSGADDFTQSHVPYGASSILSTRDILKLAKHVWNQMCDVDSAVPMSHDGYLKKYQLGKPALDAFDLILFDEAQDANGANLAILQNAKCAVAYVGDAHQQIYQFRGSHNALDRISNPVEYRLSKSFRFGGNIAKVASTILQYHKEETTPLTGRDDVADGEDLVSSCDTIREECDQYTFISRVNSSLFVEALRLVEEGISYTFAGDADKQMVADITDIFHLYNSEKWKVRNTLYNPFDNFRQLQRYVDDTKDFSVGWLMRIVATHKQDTLSHLQNIQSYSTTPENAQVVLTTAHKAKGLEWDNVILADDFSRAIKDDGSMSDAEANLLYVACTRARNRLGLPESVQHHLEKIIDVELD